MKHDNLISKIINWLTSLLRPLFKITLHHDNLKSDCNLIPDQPVCYVIKYHSFIDLMLLDSLCKEHKLPRPQHFPHPQLKGAKGSYLYLQKRGWLSTTNKKQAPPAPLNSIVDYGIAHPEYNMQFIPIHIYWGRNPGKENSAIKLLFFDAEFSGLVQRFLTIIYQARRVQVRFGLPLKLQDIYTENISAEDAAKKLKRIIRVHFKKIRTALLGPELYTVEMASRNILRAAPVREAIAEQSRKANVPAAKIELQAQKIIREISADTSYSFVRFFDIILPRLFRIIYNDVEIKNGDYLRELAQSHTLVYLPCHRSHVDYLLVGFFIHAFGLMSPHIGGGDNLNFWPVGPLLRRAGAFFLRRKFRGNRLYSAIFNEYIHYIISKGHPLAFFQEGGRSRTGFLLQPKTGMLAMVVHSFLRDPKPIAFIPISISYDQVVEAESYQKELSGLKKEKENFSGLLRASRVLRKKHGKAYLKFGSPIHLERYLKDNNPNWQNLEKGEAQRPTWVTSLVNDLAELSSEHINAATVVSPVAMIVSIILATPQRALAEDDLVDAYSLFKTYLHQLHAHSQVEIACDDAKEAIQRALTYSNVTKHVSRFGDIVFISEQDSFSLYYYKNNITHLFTYGSLLASFFNFNDHLSKKELLNYSREISQFLREELFIAPLPGNKDGLTHALNSLVELKLLKHDTSTDFLYRPDLDEKNFAFLQILARLAGGFTQHIAIIAMVLEASINFKKQLTITQILEESQHIYDRFELLGRIPSQMGIPQNLGLNFCNYLIRSGKITVDSSGVILGSEEFFSLEKGLQYALSPDIVTSLLRNKGTTLNSGDI